MARVSNEKIVAQGGLQVPGGASDGLSAATDALGNLKWIARIFVQQSAPTPPANSGEYVWFVTDGAGGITDIRSGKA